MGARSPFFLVLLAAACAPLPPPDAKLVFGALGDTPYSQREVESLERVIEEMNGERLAFVVHVGDVGSSRQACTDAWLAARKQQLAAIKHPFLLLPGDNEWANCRNPEARLEAWRSRFCFHETIPGLARQAGPHCEHVRWEAAGRVFVALNVPGHDNNFRHPEFAPRMKAVLGWLDEAARLAAQREGLVIFMQANPFVALVPGEAFAPLLARLRELGEHMPGRVMLVHGDTHIYRDDEPLPGLRRVEVWGSPFVAWTPIFL